MQSEPGLVRTIRRLSRVEIDRIKASRFIADIAPCTDEATARAVIDSVRAREPSATHHCWAFRLADGRALASDDGEPHGTAGAPILRRIEGHDLADVVIVVTRYYGGTNLGRGGLIRAYGGAALASIESAEILTRAQTVRFELVHSYEMSAKVNAALAAFDAKIEVSDYGADVSLIAIVPQALADEFSAMVSDGTAGTVLPKVLDS